MPKVDDETATRREIFRQYCRDRGWDNGGGRWSTGEISNATGKAINKISNLLHGTGSFGPKIARDLEAALGLGKYYLDGEIGDDFVDVPRVNVQLAAGDGIAPQVEEVIGHLKFARSFLRGCGVSAQSARVVDVKGPSMEPTIKDGAVLLISTNNREPVENQVFALVRPIEGLVVKRLVKLDGHWFARSDNRDFADVRIDAGEPITVIGRAVWMGAKL